MANFYYIVGCKMPSKKFFVHNITIYHTTTRSAVSNFSLKNMTVEEVTNLEVLRMLNADIDNEETYVVRITFNNVYFRHNKKVNMVDKGLENGSSGTIYIPTEIDLSKYIETGDILFEGAITEKFEDIYDSSDYHSYRIVSIDDNRKGGLQHYKLGVAD